MGKLDFCGYLISRFYLTRELRENLMHAKNMCFTVAGKRVSLPASKWLDLQSFELPSMLWRCWLGDRKGILPVKTLHQNSLATVVDISGCGTGFSTYGNPTWVTRCQGNQGRNRLTQVCLKRRVPCVCILACKYTFTPFCCSARFVRFHIPPPRRPDVIVTRHV